MLLVTMAVLFQVDAAAPSLDQILARVAENQARSQEARTSYVYTQRMKVRLYKPGGALTREEKREYRIAPAGNRTDKQLIRVEGRYAHGSTFVAYDQAKYHYKGIDLDGDLTDSLADDLTNDPESKDGIGQDLFPLTAKEQSKYTFKLKGREQYRGRDVYRITFEPRAHDGGDWDGEAVIDAEEWQPIAVQTRLAHGIPAAVKVLLGTNVRGVGLSITYRKFGDVWFPATYGGEFWLRVLFGYKRNISLDLVNSDFVHTHVESAIQFEDVLKK